MHPFTQSLAADHIAELRQNADAERLAMTAVDDRTGRAAGWRRSLGSGAERLSVSLEAFAIRLDPTVRRVPRGLRRYGAE
jgi:hypothetical protein